MSICTAQSATTGFVGGLTRFVDCQVHGFATSAYGSLATPGSTISILLTGLITILVALIGYNLMFGQAPSLRSGMATFVKVAMVVTLATSWQAYSTLVYNVVVEGPDQLVAEIGRPAALPGADGSLTAHLDATDAALVRLTMLGPGQVTVDQQAAHGGLPPFVGFNVFALGTARIIFLLTAAGGLIIVRVIAGLMLALGPLFLAFLLFANTRSLFEGWVRVLAGAALGSVGVSIVLGLELSLLEPWLAAVVARRAAGESMIGMPAELMVVMTLFGLVMIGAVAAVAKLARAFRLATAGALAAPWTSVVATTNSKTERSTVAGQEEVHERTRAATVANSLMMLQRRESRLPQAGGSGSSGFTGARASNGEIRGMINAAANGGRARSSGRRTGSRASASAARRDAQ
jgi:type IV secretion system protein VirB6